MDSLGISLFVGLADPAASYGVEGAVYIGCALKHLMSQGRFGAVMRSPQLPNLPEDDVIEKKLFPETVALLIMEDIDRPELSPTEKRKLAEAIREEGGAYGRNQFAAPKVFLRTSSWCPGKCIQYTSTWLRLTLNDLSL